MSGRTFERRVEFVRVAGLARFVALMAVAFAVVPGPALATVPLPTLDSETGTGPRWASYRFTTDGSPATFEIGAHDLSRGQYLAVYLYTATNELRAGAGWISVGWKSGYSVRLPAVGVDIDMVASPRPDGTMRLILSLNDPAFPPPLVGTFKVLMVAAGDAQGWDYAVRGTGVTGLVEDLGDRTFFYLTTDFQATAQASAHVLTDAGGSTTNVGARATIAGRYSIDIADTLIGDFSSGAFVPTQTFSVDGPNGRIDCGFFGCGFNRFTGPFHRGPGRYTFNTTGVNGGPSYLAELVLCGADARLPA